MTASPESADGPVDGAAGAPISVVVIDDDPLVRSGLGLILGGAPDIAVVGEAGDGADGVAAVREHEPDVALMDIRMPRRDGLAATRELVAGGTPSRILVLTTFDADELVVDALRAGAAGFLLKDTAPPKLVAGVRAVAAGEPILSPTVTARLISSVAETGGPRQADAPARLAELTEREREIAVAVAHGRSNAEIASRMYLGLPTVKAHVSRILTKLDARNRVHIALAVYDAGLR